MNLLEDDIVHELLFWGAEFITRGLLKYGYLLFQDEEDKNDGDNGLLGSLLVDVDDGENGMMGSLLVAEHGGISILAFEQVHT